MKVLMAEDEESILNIMARKVAAAGFQVITAADGQEAWDKIRSEDPDVIVLDLTMPRMTGWEVLQRLRGTPPSKKWQPVIIVSALNEVQNMQDGFELKADHYLAKPCSIDDIIKAIRLMAALIPMRNA